MAPLLSSAVKKNLMSSVVLLYTHDTLGKKRRLTFMECNNDINSMIDIGKVADLVLLLIDASYGFEMVYTLFFLLLSGLYRCLTVAIPGNI
jgi:ribosome biogenesis protein BMS1